MQLEEFYDYKTQLFDDILTSEKIVHLINENVSIDDAGKLVYTQVFPFEYVPETNQEAMTYVCCDVDVQALDGYGTYYSPTLYIWIFTHKSLLRLPEGGVRTDKLCSEVAKKINGSFFYGLGKLKLYAAKRFAPITDYQGKVLTFHTDDFNVTYDPHRPIPANRKNH